jgi:hypothetical protein
MTSDPLEEHPSGVGRSFNCFRVLVILVLEFAVLLRAIEEGLLFYTAVAGCSYMPNWPWVLLSRST